MGRFLNLIDNEELLMDLDTALNRVPALEAQKKMWCSRTPMNRLGNVDELNNTAVFLASDASTFMTGSDLVIDVSPLFSLHIIQILICAGWLLCVVKRNRNDRPSEPPLRISSPAIFSNKSTPNLYFYNLMGLYTPGFLKFVTFGLTTFIVQISVCTKSKFI